MSQNEYWCFYEACDLHAGACNYRLPHEAPTAIVAQLARAKPHCTLSAPLSREIDSSVIAGTEKEKLLGMGRQGDSERALK